ncbi:type I-G CRISPR-associated protein Csb2 [Corynebacterium cystitidis]|uniref:CRISPR-associated protein Csb2 n=1 Tax=Corynebacterium cystitidis DSM 20524 TaxID=1121357 RepID=A0A1H9UMH9_9CORY|nr:type I-U CRISPR-associated protein Csb2 [Corynebacterium cystitidis]WJY81026.1 CRISPR-associated protein, family [Corynebacterium cystitidis DSM 20524]SES10337.1 CRISPR-associated protein Csb2 [Corynebacterium cystitidis DSM 20524]SNV90593.1 putative CRISPR-associated protein [Corynebacterium cystitidis]
MTKLELRVRFPLWIYQAHRDDKSPSWMPDPARLHSAFLNAAAQGSLAEPDGATALKPSEESLTALRWLEANAPDGIEEPQKRWCAPNSGRFAYRKVTSGTNSEIQQRPVSDGVAVNGSYGYLWNDVPEAVASTLTALSEDIGYLGEASSVAIVEPGPVNPTLVKDSSASAFDSGGSFVRIPQRGRTDYLIARHKSYYPEKPPTVAKDRWTASEKPRDREPAEEFLSKVMYRVPAVQPPDTPWSHVLLFQIDRQNVPVKHRVELCVTMHKALISAIGFGASPMVTGKYERQVKQRPANRLAIQYFDSSYVQRHGVHGAALGLMIPRDADDQQLAQIAQALSAISVLWSRNLGRVRVTFDGVSVAADKFWAAPADGHVRLWSADTAIIPETRPVSKKALNRPWTLEDAGLLSLGFVWRDEFEIVGKGEHMYAHLRNQVAGSQARVYKASTLGDAAASYVHRTHTNVPVQPWNGLLSLGNLANAQTLVAIGQSRHLGGGLLVPVDLPRQLLQSLNKQEV